MKKLFPFLALLLVALAIPITTTILKTKQTLNQHASTPCDNHGGLKTQYPECGHDKYLQQFKYFDNVEVYSCNDGSYQEIYNGVANVGQCHYTSSDCSGTPQRSYPQCGQSSSGCVQDFNKQATVIVHQCSDGSYVCPAQLANVIPGSCNYPTPTPSPTPQPQNLITKENQLPGTTSWLLTNVAQFSNKLYRSPDIEGYANQTSAQTGDTVTFSVSSTSKTFQADIYRMGWYQGKGANLKKTITNISGNFYPIPTMDSTTGLIEAQWPSTFSIAVDPSWISGVYLVKLTASSGKQSYISFVVHDSRSSNFVLLHTTNTDEAYNYWGGESLYFDASKKFPKGEAYQVSFDRPDGDIYGSGFFFEWEYQMIRFLEKNGYDLNYLSDTDVKDSPQLLLNHKGILIVGHSEYWTHDMRNNLEAAVNKGVNLANFASNSIYWQSRYEPQAYGQHLDHRVITCYKYTQFDPLYGKNNSRVTVQFRQPPVNLPEQSLLGSMFESLTSNHQTVPWVVADSSSWILKGTNMKNGDTIPGVVGWEYDKVLTSYPIPQGVNIISSSPIVDMYKDHSSSNSTIYTAQSGATIINMGTLSWSWGVDSLVNPYYSHVNAVNTNAQIITNNIFQDFINGNHQQHIHQQIQNPITKNLFQQNASHIISNYPDDNDK